MNNPTCYQHAATIRFNSGDDFTRFAAIANNPIGWELGATVAGVHQNNPTSQTHAAALYRNNPRG